MSEDRLLICTDLDRTLIPNGSEKESAGAREHFVMLIAHDSVRLAYVSGRHRELVEQAMEQYSLPQPDFVVADVGTSLYQLDTERHWRRLQTWEPSIAADWNGNSHQDLVGLLRDLPALRMQEEAKQNRFKLSYYLSLDEDREQLFNVIEQRLQQAGIRARLIWSVDDPLQIGLLDILPASASKLHALRALMQAQHFDAGNTVFCGDSGNDLQVLCSEIPSVLVANAVDEVRRQALDLSERAGHRSRLYLARGEFMGMNGNYSAGMLEGIASFHPHTIAWMGFEQDGSQS